MNLKILIYYRVKFKNKYSKNSYIIYYNNLKYYFIGYYGLK